MRLTDFKIEESFASARAYCYVAVSKQDGKKYFIKSPIDVSYGDEAASIELRKEYKREADEWLNYHNQVLQTFSKLGPGNGNIVFPIKYFVDEGRIYELCHYAPIEKIAVSNAEKFKPTDKIIGELNDGDKIRILQTSSYSLKLIHELGIIHFDLKPDNIPISQSEMGGYISKITDCDDAVLASNIPSKSLITCTEPYWSPELAVYIMGNEKVKQRLNCKNDVFAMGLIFHEWWTGDFPYYEGRDDFVYLYQVVHNLWPNKIKMDSSVPNWLSALILDMLYPEPEKRPSMDTVFEAIKNKSYESVIKSTKKATAPKPSFDELKRLMGTLPQGKEIHKYTEESYNYLKETLGFIKSNINRFQTQEQIDKITAKLNEAINELIVKPQDNKFKKIENAIATIESKDLSRYTLESRDNLLKLVNFAKRQKDELTDENNINRLYSAIVNAYKSLTIINDFSIEVINPLPAPYTKVEILSDDYVMAYYGDNGKIKLLADNAIKMKLIIRK